MHHGTGDDVIHLGAKANLSGRVLVNFKPFAFLGQELLQNEFPHEAPLVTLGHLPHLGRVLLNELLVVQLREIFTIDHGQDFLCRVCRRFSGFLSLRLNVNTEEQTNCDDYRTGAAP